MDKYGFPNPKEHEEWKQEAVRQAAAKYKYKDEYYVGNNHTYSFNDVIVQAYEKKIMEELLRNPVNFNFKKPERPQLGLL